MRPVAQPPKGYGVSVKTLLDRESFEDENDSDLNHT